MRVADYKELRVFRPFAEDHTRLSDQYDHICRQLTKMMQDATLWCGNDSALREIPAEYLVTASQPGEQGDAPDAPRS